MKKILSITCLAILLLSNKVYSQSNLTWIVRDKIEDNSFKTMVNFKIDVTGLNSDAEAVSYCNKILENKDVKSCENLGKNTRNEYSISLTMNHALEASYYIQLAERSGVNYIMVNRERKTTAEWAAKQQRK